MEGQVLKSILQSYDKIMTEIDSLKAKLTVNHPKIAVFTFDYTKKPVVTKKQSFNKSLNKSMECTAGRLLRNKPINIPFTEKKATLAKISDVFAELACEIDETCNN